MRRDNVARSGRPEIRKETLLQRLVDVRPEERGPLVWAMMFALLAVASAIVSRALSDALFLTTYPLSDVPRFFVVSNVILIAGAMTYSALLRAVRPVPLNMVLLALIAASMALGPTLLNAAHESAVFGLCVWLTVAAPLLNIVAWNAIVDRFHSRQGRRLFPIVFAASTIGAILAGIGLSPFITRFGVDNLFFAILVLVALTIPIPLLLTSRGRVDAETTHKSLLVEGGNKLWEILKEGVTSVGRNKLLRAIAVIVFLAAVVTNLVDFAFKGMLQANYTRDEIGVFYGYFNAIANTANLVLQLFVVAWAIERFGVTRIFRVLPASLLLGTVALGWMPGFITIVGLKFVDGLLRFTFQSAANEVAIAPIPYVERNRAKIFIKGVMNPFGAIAAGLILMPFAATDLVPEHYLAVILLVALAAWLFFTGRVAKTYAEQLYASLRRKQDRHTPHPEEGILFGAGIDVDRGQIRASHVRWSSLAEPPDGPAPLPEAQMVGSDGSLRERWTLTDPANPDAARRPLDGLSDASPIIRTETLERLAAAARHGSAPKLGRELLEGLLWRELNLAFAILHHRFELGDLAGAKARRALALLNARLDGAVYRVFLLVGLLGEMHTAKTAYFGFRSETGRTRAHAIDLVDALLDGLPHQRAVMLLLEEMSLESRLERASRLGILQTEVFEEPRTVLEGEHDPQLNRLLAKLRH